MTDNDGHDYIIPIGQEENFYKWVEAEENGDDSEFCFNSKRVNCSGWTFTDPQGY